MSSSVKDVSIQINWQELNQLEMRLKSALRSVRLNESAELTINIGCTSQGLFLRIRNSVDSSSVASCNSCSAFSNNYMSANNVFSQPKVTYSDKSTQCESSEASSQSTVFVSSMFFHPYRLKPNRQIKCIQCSQLPGGSEEKAPVLCSGVTVVSM